jgi:hypothetical protein
MNVSPLALQIRRRKFLTNRRQIVVEVSAGISVLGA